MGRNRQQYQYYNNQQSYQNNYQDIDYEMEDEQGGRHIS
jgi:hypothetical protein